jgi:hypothetical protein
VTGKVGIIVGVDVAGNHSTVTVGVEVDVGGGVLAMAGNAVSVAWQAANRKKQPVKTEIINRKLIAGGPSLLNRELML